jgi:hypothetical protein
LSVTGDDHLPALAEIAATLSETDGGIRLFAGGQAVTRHPDSVESYGVEPVLDGVEGIVDALTGARE